MSNILTEIFTTLTSAGTSFISFLSSMLQSIVDIFGTTDATTGNFTFNFIGILTLVGVAISFVYFALRWVTRLIKLRA